MSKPLTQQLFQLIKTLTKSEKRHFRLYATRNGGGADLKFLALFTALDAQSQYDEDALLSKVDGVSKRQLSNLKSHLYNQILVSLRLLRRKQGDLELHELLDFACVLYDKGLYLQSLEQLSKARVLARKRHRQTVLLEIIEFEKRIETRHITRSHAERAEELISWSKETRQGIGADEAWSDLALEMYGLYLRIGHVKNHEEYAFVVEYFESRIPQERGELSFFGQIYRAQARVWCHYILQNWKHCFRYATTWVRLFQEYPEFQELEFDLFVKGIHNLLSVLFYNMDRERYRWYFTLLEDVIGAYEEELSDNSRIYNFVYLEMARINRYFLDAEFELAIQEIPRIELRLEELRARLDVHRLLVFWYKFACLHFGAGQYHECIQYLQRIINYPQLPLREDIQVFARILSLIAHYELGNHDLIDAQIRSVYRYLLKLENMQQVQKAVMDFLKNSVYMDIHHIIPHFQKLQDRLEEIAKNPYERRPFLYLDLYTYLRSKIEGISIPEAARKRVEEKRY